MSAFSPKKEVEVEAEAHAQAISSLIQPKEHSTPGVMKEEAVPTGLVLEPPAVPRVIAPPPRLLPCFNYDYDRDDTEEHDAETKVKEKSAAFRLFSPRATLKGKRRLHPLGQNKASKCVRTKTLKRWHWTRSGDEDYTPPTDEDADEDYETYMLRVVEREKIAAAAAKVCSH